MTVVQNIGDRIKWSISKGKYPNGWFLGVRNNFVFTLPLIDDNALLNQYIDTEWCFERIGPSNQYAVRHVSSGLYWSTRPTFDLGTVILSTTQTAWEVLSTDGLTAKFRLAGSRLAITSPHAEAERVFLFDQDDATPYEFNPRGKAEGILTQAMLQKLGGYRTVFLLDDSPSMFGQPWAAVTEALVGIVDKAIQLSAFTEFDVQFVDNFQANKVSAKSGTEVKTIMAAIQPISPSPSDTIRDSIETIVNQAISANEAWNVIVLTDAARTDESQPTRAVNRFKKLLQNVQRSAMASNIKAYGIGIQLVQFNNSTGINVNTDFGSVKTVNQSGNSVYFDTTSYSSPLTDEKLKKILLGGIDYDINQL